MKYLQYFFNPAHLFSLRPEAMSSRAAGILSIFFVALIILGILSKLKTKKVKSGLDANAWLQLYHLFLTIGIIGMFYTFFASQGVILLGARFWILIIGIVALVWGGFIIKYLKVDLPQKKNVIQKQQNFKKYIP